MVSLGLGVCLMWLLFIQVSRLVADGVSRSLELNCLAVAAEGFDCLRQDSQLGLIGSHRYGRLRLQWRS
jgi:hypothetical protein